MLQHTAVESCSRLPIDEEYIYEVRRTRYDDTVRVWLADQYHFNDMDFHCRPRQLKKGDYVLIARPEASASVNQDLIQESKIGVGKIGELMGALNKREMWKYVSTTEQEKRERQRNMR